MEVYLITNKVNGKLYVGQTTKDVATRWALHMSDFERGRKKNYPLYLAFAKYGVENFDVSVLKDNIVSYEELDYWEMYYIKKLNTRHPNGYNLTDGGQGVHGYRHTEETKRKIGKTIKSKYDEIYTPERSKKISDANKGKKFSDEHKQKLSDIAKHRTGEKNPFYGKHHSDEIKKKWSDDMSYTYQQIDKITGEVINSFSNINEAARYIKSLHITDAKEKSIAHGISMCCEQRYKSSYGYIWKSFPNNNKV